MNRPVHFEIHASDQARAAKFYQSVFGWEIKKWELPAGVDTDGKEIPGGDMGYWMIMTDPEKKDADAKFAGIDGGMVIRKGASPSPAAPVNAFVCTIQVENVDDYAAKVEAAGGKVVVPKMPIPTMGWLVYCIDTELNIFGLMSLDPNAK